MKRRVAVWIVAAALVLAAAPVFAQIGDLSGTTPCCDKVCNGDGTSTRCGDLIAGGLSTLSGCAGIDDQFPATCVGGQLLNSTQPALLAGCACLLGTCIGPIAAGGGQLTPEQCTQLAVAACQDTGNVVTEPDASCPGGGGGCDPACTGGKICDETNTCVCPSGETDCGGTCVNTLSDPNNCGQCGTTCSQGQTCSSGTCQGGGCTSDADCPQGQHCDTGTGTCVECTQDSDCPQGEVCDNGTCVQSGCTSDADCPAGQVCDNGTCVPACPEGQTQCGDICTDTSSDPDNCGTCGNVCGPHTGCLNGQCVQCKNKSGGGDQTNPGGGGNPAGCNNPGGVKKGLP